MNTELDHLVFVADSLEQGARWCESVLGVAPGPGGRHATMGTHNRLLRIDSPGFPRAYLEILAVDPQAPPPGRPRWFGMDDPRLMSSVRQAPRLVQAVQRSDNVEMLRWGLIHLGLDPGEPLALSRDTPSGPLRWRLLVRADGALAADGALPPLIQWQGEHPADAMPASPLQLQAVEMAGLDTRVRQLLRPRGVRWADNPDAPALRVTLQTPHGPVTLSSAPPGE